MSLDLLAFFARTCVVAGFACVLLALFRRGSAARLHAVSGAALISTLVLIPASLVFTHALTPLVTTPVSPVIVTHLAAAPANVPPSVSQQARVAVQEPVAAPTAIQPVVRSVNLALLWGIGTAVLLMRFLGSVLLVGTRLRRSTRLDLGSGVVTRIDPLAAVPMALWWGEPIVVLPGSWESWSAERLDTVMKHEKAHLQRGDCWIQPLGALACAVAWPNPLIWWLAARSKSLAEQAVDDFVLASGVAPATYAQDLLDIARHGRKAARGLELPMATPRGVEGRIRRIMNDQRQRGSITLAAIASLGIGFSALAVAASAWSLAPQRVEAAIAKSLPASVSSSLETLDPLSGATRGSRDPLTFTDQPASYRVPSSEPGKSWDLMSPGEGAESPAATTQASTQNQQALGARDGDPLGKVLLSAQLYWIDTTAPDPPKQFGSWSTPNVQPKEMDAFVRAITAAGGQLKKSTQLIHPGSDPSPAAGQPDDAKLSFLSSDPTDGSFVARIVMTNAPAEPSARITRLRLDEPIAIPVPGGHLSHHTIWIFRLYEKPAAIEEPSPRQAAPSPPQQAFGAPGPDPAARFQMVGSLYLIDVAAPALPKQFGTWARPTVQDKDIPAFELAIKAAGGQLKLKTDLVRWPSDAQPFVMVRGQDDAAPSFDPNVRMDGSVLVRIMLLGRPWLPQQVDARLRPDEHAVLSQQTRDGLHRRIWIFRLIDASANNDQGQSSDSPDVVPEQLLIHAEHLSVSRWPDSIAVQGIRATTFKAAGSDVYQEWMMSASDVANLRRQLDRAGAISVDAPIIRTLTGESVRTFSGLSDGGESDMRINMDAHRFLRLEVEFWLTKDAPKVTHTSMDTLDPHCCRVMIFSTTPHAREVFIVSVEPVPDQ